MALLGLFLQALHGCFLGREVALIAFLPDLLVLFLSIVFEINSI